MTIKQTEDKIKQAGGDIDKFWEFMRGQTMSLNEDGTTEVYDCDVERFIRYNCNPKNEPMIDWD